MFTKREKINASRSSLDSLCVEHHLERDGSDTESSHSETATPLIVKRSFQLYHQIIADIRQRPVSLKIWLPSTLFLAAVIIVVRILSPGFGYYNGCVVDGSFQIEYELSAIWAISDFFQVNIAAGNLTFTQAKVVDTTWDLVVGRGGQATLSLITWKVFADYAAVSMTIQPVTFATYRTLFTESGPSVSSTTRLFHDFIKYKRLSSKLASGFLIYSMLLSLALPTLSSAATGYVPLNEAFIRHDDDNLVPFSRFELTSYRPDLIWEYSNRTYHTGELESLGSCVPVKDRYQWGASFLQIFVLLILTAVWVIGCLAVLISSHSRYRFAKSTGPPKGYQALGILAESIDEQLGDGNVKVSTMTDQQLKIAINTKLAGGSMSLNTPGQIETFRIWYAKERVWFISLCFWVTSALGFFVTIILDVYFFLFPFLFLILLFLSIGTLFAIIVGQTLGSRLILILCWTVVGVGVGLGSASLPYH